MDGPALDEVFSHDAVHLSASDVDVVRHDRDAIAGLGGCGSDYVPAPIRKRSTGSVVTVGRATTLVPAVRPPDLLLCQLTAAAAAVVSVSVTDSTRFLHRSTGQPTA